MKLKFISILFFTLFISFCSLENKTDPSLLRLQALDVKLPPPRPGDWLDVHHEKGQTFEQYKNGKPFRPSESMDKIYLQPVGDFSPIQKKIIQYTADYLQIFFDRTVLILSAKPDKIIPESGRRNNQLLTGAILDLLEREIPDDAIGVMAITSKDLYPGNNWNFVFGQARLNKRVCVSSLFRYSPPEMDELNYQVCLERLIKTSSHEIGHMLSVLHCTHALCLMNGSNSLAEADSRPNRLCSQCLSKIQWNLKFGISDRMKKMEKYFLKHTLESDHRLVTKDIAAIQKSKSN